MDFLVKIGNTGQFRSYRDIEPSDKILVLQERIKRDFEIEIGEQILLTKKGMKICSDDIFIKVQNENLFSQTSIQS